MVGLGKRGIGLSFVAAALIPMGVLAWLGVHILRMDRDVERQRATEGLRIARQRLALEIERRLREVEDELGRGHGLRFTMAGIEQGSPRVF